MNLLTFFLLATVFLFAASIVGMVYLFLAESRYAARWTVRKRLLYMSAGGKTGQDKLAYYKQHNLKNASLMERVAYAIPRISSLDRMLIKAGMPLNASTFIFSSFAMGSLGLVLTHSLLQQPGSAIVGILCFLVPYFLLKNAERKAMDKFQEQLPESLDFLARTLRSGHGLTSGFEMIAKEMEDPIKSEFAATVDEINLGLSFGDALENLCTRVPSRDLRYFAIAIQIQRETGGNLAEILDNISHLIHERVKFQRMVKTLTADGRMSAITLFCLPVLLATYTYFVNYDYISLLWKNQFGLYMVFTASVAMILGAFIMKRITNVEM